MPTPSLVNSREKLAILVATPSLVNSREELARLVAQQQRDESLKDSWRKAGKVEEGYCMDNGVLKGTGKGYGAQTKKTALVSPWSQRVGGWSL